MAEETQAVVQAQCEDCGSSADNFSVVSRLFSDRGLYRHLRCDCRAEGIVRVSESGLSVGGPISHENASWNEE